MYTYILDAAGILSTRQCEIARLPETGRVSAY